jgi:hypothetical protein
LKDFVIGLCHHLIFRRPRKSFYREYSLKKAGAAERIGEALQMVSIASPSLQKPIISCHCFQHLVANG